MAIEKAEPRASMLDAATALAAAGFRVLPVHTITDAGYCSCSAGPNCKQKWGKHPRNTHGSSEATADAGQVAAWWRKWPTANIGVATGAGLGIVDIDPDKGGELSLARLEEAYGALPPTLTVWTGSGGRHFYYRIGVELANGEGGSGVLKNWPGLDFRGSGGYVVAPPSRHESGGVYAWDDQAAAVADMPDWLVGLLSKPAKAERRPISAAIADRSATEADGAHWVTRYLAQASEGNRNATGFLLACQLRDSGLSYDLAQDHMLDYAAGVPGDGYSHVEALRSLRSAYGRTAREPARGAMPAPLPANVTPLRRRDPVTQSTQEERHGGGSEDGGEADAYKLTELGNSERLVAAHADKLIYCFDWHRWLAWDGQRWATDNAGAVGRLAKSVVRGIYHEAAEIEDDKARGEILKHATRSESAKSISAMLTLAQSDLPVTPAELDSADTDWLLNCPNGVVDLRNGRLGPSDPALRITRVTAAPYDPTAECPTWLAFLDRILAGDQALIAFVQRAIGYSLTGSTREQVLFIPHGSGHNGKSTLLEALGAILGDYAMQAAPATFMAKHNEGIPNDIAALKGARFVAAAETEAGQRLAESLVKQATGGDQMVGRFMRGEFFAFRPAFKLWLATNHKPVIRGTDHAIWRRIRLIPFAVTIPDNERDGTLPEKLLAEGAGILSWAVQGCLDWQRDGLTAPPAVVEATAAYRGEMDVLAAFLQECCEFGPRFEVPSKSLYAAFEAWCEDANERPGTRRAFSLRIQERGITSRIGHANTTIWLGIKLLDASSPTPDPGRDRITQDGLVGLVGLGDSPIDLQNGLREASIGNFANHTNHTNHTNQSEEDKKWNICPRRPEGHEFSRIQKLPGQFIVACIWCKQEQKPASRG